MVQERPEMWRAAYESSTGGDECDADASFEECNCSCPELDAQIERLMKCEFLKESEVKA